MAITKKPRAQAKTATVDVDALIRKGGSVASDKEENTADKTTSVILRIPGDVMSRIDAAVAARRIKTPRHTWLLEAVMEKLDRESREE